MLLVIAKPAKTEERRGGRQEGRKGSLEGKCEEWPQKGITVRRERQRVECWVMEGKHGLE